MDQTGSGMAFRCSTGLGTGYYEEQVDALSSLTCFPGAIPYQFWWCVKVHCHLGLKLP